MQNSMKMIIKETKRIDFFGVLRRFIISAIVVGAGLGCFFFATKKIKTLVKTTKRHGVVLYETLYQSVTIPLNTVAGITKTPAETGKMILVNLYQLDLQIVFAAS
jgi:hypothetical protein